jgi:hypothetical protein
VYRIGTVLGYVELGSRLLAAFPGLHSLVDADFVGNGPAAGADGSADEGAFAAAEKAPNHGSSDRRSGDDLGSGVVAMVVRTLRADSPVMTTLRVGLGDSREGESEKAGEDDHSRRPCELHSIPPCHFKHLRLDAA